MTDFKEQYAVAFIHVHKYSFIRHYVVSKDVVERKSITVTYGNNFSINSSATLSLQQGNTKFNGMVKF